MLIYLFFIDSDFYTNNIYITFSCDKMTLSILSIVILISTFVQIYSLTYMNEDPYKIKFLIYLILFTWFMIVLVMSENLITFF